MSEMTRRERIAAVERAERRIVTLFEVTPYRTSDSVSKMERAIKALKAAVRADERRRWGRPD